MGSIPHFQPSEKSQCTKRKNTQKVVSGVLADYLDLAEDMRHTSERQSDEGPKKTDHKMSFREWQGKECDKVTQYGGLAKLHAFFACINLKKLTK